MSAYLPQGVETYWRNNSWDRAAFENSKLGAKYKRQRALTSKAIKKYKPRKVLVLCCGVGLETLDISKFSFVSEITAIDINRVSCQKTRAITDPQKVTVISSDVYTIKYNQVFDAVVCMDALQHLGNQKLLLSKVHQALKPTGVFIGDYSSKELFRSWMHQKHKPLKVWRIHTKHRISNMLLRLHLLPAVLVEKGWIRAFLLTSGEVEDLLKMTGFKVVNLVSDEWHFFIAKKS